MPGILDSLRKVFSGALGQEMQKIVYRPKKPPEDRRVRVGGRPGTHGHTFEKVMESKGKGKTCQLCAGSGKALVGEDMHEELCPICKGTGHSSVEIPKAGGPIEQVRIQRVKHLGRTNETVAKTITPPAHTAVKKAIEQASLVPEHEFITVPPSAMARGPVTESGGIYPRSLPLGSSAGASVSLTHTEKPLDPPEGSLHVDTSTGHLEIFSKGRWLPVGMEPPAAIKAAASIKRRAKESVRIEPQQLEAEPVIPRTITPSEEEKETLRALAEQRKKESEW